MSKDLEMIGSRTPWLAENDWNVLNGLDDWNVLNQSETAAG